MRVDVLTITRLDKLGQYPLLGRCQYYQSQGDKTFCGRAGVCILQVHTRDAHVLCKEHAEKVFLELLKE